MVKSLPNKERLRGRWMDREMDGKGHREEGDSQLVTSVAAGFEPPSMLPARNKLVFFCLLGSDSLMNTSSMVVK